MRLAAKQRSSTALALDASGGAGQAQLDVNIKGPEGLTLARHYTLDVKPATQILARRTVRSLAKGESLNLTSDMFSDLVRGSGGVQLSVGLSTALDAATILKALDRYPFGCTEQITSRAMPLLYVNDSGGRGASRHGHRCRSAHRGVHRSACWPGKAPTVRSDCGRPVATMPGSMLT